MNGLVGFSGNGFAGAPSQAEKLWEAVLTATSDFTYLRQRGYSIRAVRHTRNWAYELVSEPAVLLAPGS